MQRAIFLRLMQTWTSYWASEYFRWRWTTKRIPGRFVSTGPKKASDSTPHNGTESELLVQKAARRLLMDLRRRPVRVGAGYVSR